MDERIDRVAVIRSDLDELRRELSCWEGMTAFLVIPFLLLAIDSIVTPEQWALDVTEPSLFTSQAVLVKAFTSAYVHGGPLHLWSNIFGYLLLMLGILPLTIVTNRKKHLFAWSLLFLTVGAFWTSYFSLVVPFDMNALGFSGINAVFLGYLVILVFIAVNEQTEVDLHPVWSLGPALLSIAAIVWYLPTAYPPMNPVPHLVLGFGLPGVLLTAWPSYKVYQGRDAVQPVWENKQWLILWAVLIALAGLNGLFFGIEPSIEKNVFAHFGGYFIGYFLPFALATTHYLQELTTKWTLDEYLERAE